MSEEKKTTKIDSTLEIRATASLDAEIRKELEIPDVSVEQAKAFIEKLEEDEDDKEEEK